MHYLLPKIASFCAYQDRSKVEIVEKMQELEIPEADWEEIFAFLKKEKYWDETRFARSFIGGKFRVKGWGRRKIAYEIYKHKIPQALFDVAWEEEVPYKQYEETIKSFIEKKKAEFSRDTKMNQKAKIVRYLQQKGYTFEEFGDFLDE